MKFYSFLMLASLFSFSAYATEAQVVSIKFIDGTKAIASEDVQAVFRDSQEAIDSVELKNGAIFYDTEILETTYQVDGTFFTVPGNGLTSWPQDFAFHMGGDGSGGG